MCLPLAPPLAEAPPPDDPVLEWDPSVDVGHAVRHDDADSSYSSAGERLRPLWVGALPV